MLQFEDVTAAPATGWLEHLIDAFPDEAESFDLSGYAKGGVCMFLSVLPSAVALPARRQIAGVLRQIGEQVLAGRTVLTIEAAPSEAAAVRRLAAVLAEVVIDGSSKDFPLLAASRQADGKVEIWVSQGFRDLVLGRWDQWGPGDDRVDADPAPELAAFSWALPQGVAVAAAEPPPPSPEVPRGSRETFRCRLGRLAGAFSLSANAVLKQAGIEKAF